MSGLPCGEVPGRAKVNPVGDRYATAVETIIVRFIKN